MMQPEHHSDVQKAVRERYATIARSVGSHPPACCGPVGAGADDPPAAACCGGGSRDPISSDLYSQSDAASIPAEALAASLGCGNPTALLPLRAGQTVLDLGSGGGIDVLLSARRVGPTGKVYGLDMTDEMLALARENQRRAGALNVEFLKGTIEAIPLPDSSVDVIISNCVINLSTDKDAVLREAFRVLKPGGRFAVADVVVRGEVPAEVRQSMELWVGCIAGALEEKEYASKLRAAGFEEIEVDVWRVYESSFASAFIRARKPAGACCSSECCGR
jgi:SAM-dependent methyltransferase